MQCLGQQTLPQQTMPHMFMPSQGRPAPSAPGPALSIKKTRSLAGAGRNTAGEHGKHICSMVLWVRACGLHAACTRWRHDPNKMDGWMIQTRWRRDPMEPWSC
eukprot:1157456-Pelagomonas_calceolata.AAC.2